MKQGKSNVERFKNSNRIYYVGCTGFFGVRSCPIFAVGFFVSGSDAQR